MNVLSLFNGMGFGALALQTLDIEVKNYYSSEIDKYAIQAADALYPQTQQLGDVTKWCKWGIDFGSIDLLLAGFPCQAWSLAGQRGGLNDPRGALVHTLLELWAHIKELNPNVKFLFENVRMEKDFLEYMNNVFGVEPILINSSLVSAQNRKRYYWTNIPGVCQPEDKGLTLGDIWAGGVDIHERYLAKREGTMSFKKSRKSTKTLQDKSNTLTAGGQIIANSGATNVVVDGRYYRPGVIEAARLQTVPEQHIPTLMDSGLSNTQLHKVLGNGWTHDVIVHLFKGLVPEEPSDV